MISTSRVNEIINAIERRPYNDDVLNLRKEIFVPKQTIGNIRKWFNKLSTLKLTSSELKIVEKIIVKPKSTEVFIVNNIIKYQDLSNTEIERWISYVPENSLRSIAMSVIFKPMYDNTQIKLMLVGKLLSHINYIDNVFDNLANNMRYQGVFWKEVFNLIIIMIKKEDSIAEKIATKWTQSKDVEYLDSYAYHLNIESRLLYEKTGKLQYLSKTTKEIFIF